MSRELKFRIWDIKNKKWESEFGIYQDGLIGDFSECFHNNVGKNGEHYLAQQFTGLKDKNDKEIYEGDIAELAEEFGDDVPKNINLSDHRIIKFPTDAHTGYIMRGLHIGQVKFHDGAFRLFGRTIVPSLTCVRGNIYENPELLK